MSDVELARRQAIGDLLRRSALRHGDKTALLFGEERRSYSELDAIVSRTGYKRPKRVVFVDALPTNASGKIVKRDRFADLAA